MTLSVFRTMPNPLSHTSQSILVLFLRNWEAEIKRMFPGMVYILKLSARLKIPIDIFQSAISTPLTAKIIEQEEKAVNAEGV